jgi:hypothetical protein
MLLTHSGRKEGKKGEKRILRTGEDGQVWSDRAEARLGKRENVVTVFENSIDKIRWCA